MPPPMEPPVLAPPTSAASSKLRLMCSYGGQIVPRRHTKSLFYSGCDTRIVSIPAATAAALSSFTAAVSSALSVPAPFTLKYQLPGHDLDSLISLTSDDDLLILLDELPRLPPPSRIRLFLFPPRPAQPELTQSVLCHPKTESWFIDALNSARIVQNENLSGGGGGGALSGAESIVLETNSSFGSTSSSVSLSNLPSGKPQDEENWSNFQENRARLPLPDPSPSDNRGPNPALHPQTGIYHEQPVKVATFETRAARSMTTLEPQAHQTVHISGFPVQPLHHYQNQPICLVPVSSTRPPYQLHPTNAPYPPYVFPSNPNLNQAYGPTVQIGQAGQPQSTVSSTPSSNPQQYADLHQVQQNLPQPLDFDHMETLSPRNEFDDEDPAHVQIYKSQPPLPTLPSQYQTMTKATTLLLSEAFAQLHTDGIKQQMKP